MEIHDPIEFYNSHEKVRLSDTTNTTIFTTLEEIAAKRGDLYYLLFITEEHLSGGFEDSFPKIWGLYYHKFYVRGTHLGKLFYVNCITDKWYKTKYIDGIQLMYSSTPTKTTVFQNLI